MRTDKNSALALGSRITRRDFLNSVPIGSGIALCYAAPPLLAGAEQAPALLPEPNLDAAWYGYGGVGDYAATRPKSSTARTPLGMEVLRAPMGSFDHR